MKLIILIAHFNHPEGLEKSLLSINEPFDVDVIIVDDGSKHKPDPEHLNSIYKKGKLFFEFLPHNQGVGMAANHGLKIIQEMDYDLIGRLDCGDLNKPNKYQKQIEYLKNHQDVKLLGTWADVVDEKGNLLYVLKHPTTFEEIKNKMYINSSFINPTVIFYTEILKTVGNYPEKYRHAAQDYAFFFKVIKHFKAENYPESLLNYIIEERSISTQKRKLQIRNRIKIIKDNFYFGFHPILGIMRACVLLNIPRNITTKFREFSSKNQ